MIKGKDYIGIGVGAIIINDEGKYFLAKRGAKVRNESGKWEFPGGGVEWGELHKEALVREIKEEYDIEIEIIKLLTIHDHLIPDEGQHWLSPSYICRIKSGTPKIMEPDKCDEIGWFTMDELKSLPLSIISRLDLPLLQE
jgi:8-oxo-dGTP diphosphatase